jgi:glycosyltransferase involved in cell wall biosynthesis
MVAPQYRILILTFYYPPDLAAGSFRAGALVEALLDATGGSVAIDVITTLPNRYHTFNADAPPLEDNGPLRIHRVKIPTHKSGMRDQALAYTHFWRAASALAAQQKYDLVFATSSRLTTATLGASIARRQNAKLYLDIRDIFVDTMNEVLSRNAALVLRPFYTMQERWTIARADRVNLVSPGFLPYFQERYPNHSYSCFTNGADEEFIRYANHSTLGPDQRNPIRVVYAGNMGDGQGLQAIIPQLAQALGDKARFRLIGAGGKRVQLEAALQARGVHNVELVDPVGRRDLLREYTQADVLFLHLNDYHAFKKVLPSKIFEYAAMGKPVWAGVAGYAAEFLTREVSNSAVFPPCDVDAALRALGALKIADTSRPEFIQKFSRKGIMREMAADVLAVMRA